MKLYEIGEFGLLELIANTVSRASRPDILLGIGDDAAVWHSRGLYQLGTTDILVQNVHFSLDIITWWELGWKALAVNLSDIAAMGGSPKYALVSLALPSDTEVEQVIALYQGMDALAENLDIIIIGGNIAMAPLVIISPCLIGEAEGAILTRSGALSGDKIAVTGFLGSAAAGLKMLAERLEFDDAITSYLRRSHLCPHPRIAEGKILTQNGVTTCIDLSDGLISDLSKVCQQSKVGARVSVNRVPIHPSVQAAFKEESLQLALSGGEDYELLFTAKSNVIDRLSSLMPTPITVIGEIVADKPGQVMLLDKEGKAIEWGRGGWEHFKDATKLS